MRHIDIIYLLILWSEKDTSPPWVLLSNMHNFNVIMRKHQKKKQVEGGTFCKATEQNYPHCHGRERQGKTEEQSQAGGE